MQRYRQALLVVALTIGLISTTVRAQEQGPGNGLKLSPIRNELTIERGKSDTVRISVENITKSPIAAKPFVNDFIASSDESGRPRIVLDDSLEPTPFSIKKFVPALSTLQLEPGEKEDINVKITIPKTVSPGAYYGVLRFTAGDDQGDGNVALSASVGTIFLIQVPGDTVELLKLEQIGASKGNKIGSFFNSAPDELVIRLKNEGNTFAKPFGKVRIKNMTGKTIYEYELNNTDPRGNVLPDSIRRFEDPIKGIGSIGRYKVEANISYGEGGGNIITATTAFWVLPWKWILLALIGLVLLVLLLTKGIRRYNRMVVERSRTERGRRN